MQVPSKGEEFLAFAFLLSLGGCHNGRTSGLYSVSDCSNLPASRSESATFCSDFRFLDAGTWHVFNGLITRLKNAKIARIAVRVENVRGTNEIFNRGTAVDRTGYAASCAGCVAAGCDICKRLFMLHSEKNITRARRPHLLNFIYDKATLRYRATFSARPSARVTQMPLRKVLA